MLAGKDLERTLWGLDQITGDRKGQLRYIKNHKFSEHLTLNVRCISESCIEIKIKLNFYFHTSL